MRKPFLPCIFVALLLSGCSSLKPVDKLRKQVINHGGTMQVITTPVFNFQTVALLKHQTKTLRIYIEGDGRAWRRKRPSIDPSPRKLVFLNLMFEDSYPDKLYMARPCQFIKTAQCSSVWWTDKRYSRQIVEAMNSAVDKIKAQGKWKHFELIGYSGGGTLALLLAGYRNDVISVRTIAGNLVPDFSDQIHGLSFSSSAMNPLQFAEKLRHIPQWHFVGGKDKIVPKKIVLHYIKSFKHNHCIRYKIVENASHAQGWLSVWLQLLRYPFSCH